MLNLQPLYSRLLIKRTNIRKIGSIIVPQTSEEIKIGYGEVIAKGPDTEKVQVGDFILFGRYAAYQLNKNELSWMGVALDADENVEFLLCNEEDVLCIKGKKEAA